MFAEQYSESKLKEILIKHDEFQPYPTAGERDEWSGLPEAIQERAVELGEGQLDFSWPVLTAERFLDYARNGNRSRYQSITGSRRQALNHLVYAECVEDQGRFLDQIINGIWAICEESSWCAPAHNSSPTAGHTGLPDVTEPIIDLMAAGTAAQMAWIYYLLKDKLDEVNELIAERIEYEIEERILKPYLNRDDFWWMAFRPRAYFNNWTPWVTSNCLLSFILLEEDDDRRVRAVFKGLRSLDRFLDCYHSDGGCNEGPGYWNHAGGSLFDCLETLYKATEGEFDYYKDPLIQNIGRYIYRVHISGNYFVNFSDCSSQLTVDPCLVYRYGERIGDSCLKDLGLFAHHNRENLDYLFGKPGRSLPALFSYAQMEKEPSGKAPMLGESWLDGIQVMTARQTEGTDRGLYLACKGGHNRESHNHNDVGNFILYLDGSPVIIDTGVESYRKKTFSSQRYEIWTMQSLYHNLPSVNGRQQKPGKKYAAGSVTYSSGEGGVEFVVDISPAYPEETGILSWQRSFKLIRGQEARVELVEDFELEEGTDDIVLYLMTAHRPESSASDEILLDNGRGEKIAVGYDPEELNFDCEKIEIDDRKLNRAWGDAVYRIKLGATRKLKDDSFKFSFKRA